MTDYDNAFREKARAFMRENGIESTSGDWEDETCDALASLLRTSARAVAIDCVYSARDPKWAGGDAEIDAIIAKHR
jgi:hypothetical protein